MATQIGDVATLEIKRFVQLHDTDAAGILFFARQFYFAHDAYEELLRHWGVSIAQVLRDEPYIVPIVHAESQYLKPLTVGDEITIAVQVASIGESSFVLEYELLGRDGQPIGKAKTVHVAIDKSTQEKIALPEHLRKRLEKFQSDP